MDRTSVGKGKKKTGTDTGALAVHPITGEKVTVTITCLSCTLGGPNDERVKRVHEQPVEKPYVSLESLLAAAKNGRRIGTPCTRFCTFTLRTKRALGDWRPRSCRGRVVRRSRPVPFVCLCFHQMP